MLSDVFVGTFGREVEKVLTLIAVELGANTRWGFTPRMQMTESFTA